MMKHLSKFCNADRVAWLLIKGFKRGVCGVNSFRLEQI